jgi:pimeloyl-ACP methyl ester carboxylesterase
VPGFSPPPSSPAWSASDRTLAQFAASRPTVLMFHGNGGNHGHRIPLARVFYLKMRCNVLMLSYRGYGLSEGTPSEKGARAFRLSTAHTRLTRARARRPADGRTDGARPRAAGPVARPDACRASCARAHRPPSPALTMRAHTQILYGQSIGGAVAIDLASRNPHAVRRPSSPSAPL